MKGNILKISQMLVVVIHFKVFKLHTFQRLFKFQSTNIKTIFDHTGIVHKNQYY